MRTPVFGALLTAMLLILAAGGRAGEPATPADELQAAITRIREQVDAQRVETGSVAKDAAQRALELDRLVNHMAALEHQNDELRSANARLVADLDEALRKTARIQRENDALARIASTKLQDLALAGRQLTAARSELERIAKVLADLEAGRAVLTAIAQHTPLLAPPPPDPDRLQAELANARARIEEMEAERP